MGKIPLRPFKPGEKVDNADGSYSTERTVTVQGPDGKWMNVPSLWMGPNGPVDLRPMGDDFIAKTAGQFEQQSGNKFARFGNLTAAVVAAKKRSAEGGAGAPESRYENAMAKPQRQPTPQQIDAAQRILGHTHKRVYAQGAKGATVRALQIALAAAGYEPGAFDGDWRGKTQAAFDKYMRDRGQVFGSATPKGLAFISKEIGQPLPRQRPAQPLDDLAVSGSADAMAGAPMPSASLAADIQPPAPNPSQSAEREYDPNVMHAAAMNRNEPADMAQQLDYMPPPVSPDPNDYGGDLRELGAMQPGPAPQGLPSNDQMRNMVGLEPQPQMPSMSGQPDMGNQAYQPPEQAHPYLDELGSFGSGLMDYIGNIPGSIGQAVSPEPANALRDALIQSGQGRPEYPAPNQPNTLEALRQALLAGGPRMAGR